MQLIPAFWGKGCFISAEPEGMVIIMARYEILTVPLDDASDRISSLAVNIKKVQGQLDGVLKEMPKGLGGSKQRISNTAKSVGSLNYSADKTAQTLRETTMIYKRAEQTAYGTSYGGGEPTSTKLSTPLRLRTERVQGVLFSGNTILPDWLQMAVLKYEQSK